MSKRELRRLALVLGTTGALMWIIALLFAISGHSIAGVILGGVAALVLMAAGIPAAEAEYRR